MKLKSMKLVVFISIALIIAVTLYRGLIYDRGGEHFLNHKTALETPSTISLWVDVMIVHVLFACIATITGALNFARSKWSFITKYHRLIGYSYVIAVLIVDLTSGFMAVTATGGKLTSVPFNLLNIYWIVTLYLAVHYAKRKQFVKHKSWMIRSYLFCFLNMFIHINRVWIANISTLDYRESYIIAVYLSLLLCIVIAEFIVRRWIVTRPSTLSVN